MKKALLGAFLLSLAAFSTQAYDLTTSDGTVYNDVRITKISPLGVGCVLPDGKAGWFDFRNLSQTAQKDFGYSPAAAAAFEQQLANGNGFAVPQQPAQAQAAANPASAQTSPAADPSSQLSQDQLIAQQPAPDFSAYPSDAQPVDQAPSGATVIDCANGIPATLCTADFSAGPAYWSNTYVHWGGHYYPAYYWHHWWSDHHWVQHPDGHYYPWNYYHHHGDWQNGHYYPYEHGKLYGSEQWSHSDANRDHFRREYNNTHKDAPRDGFEKYRDEHHDSEHREPEHREYERHSSGGGGHRR